MTFFEAVESIEKIVLKLNVKYKDGTPIPSVVVMGIVGRYQSTRFDFVTDSLENGTMSADDYYLEWMKMIHEFRTRPRELE